MKRALFLLFSVIVAGSAGGAFAQEQTPGFIMPAIITPDEVANLSVDFDNSFSTIPNPYFSDGVKLNYQISLLEKMVVRQAEITKIADSYAALGIPFEEPPPPRGICAQLPPNAPCLAHHPDLYADMVAERKAHYAEIMAQMQAAMAAQNPGAEVPGEDPALAEARRKAEEEQRARAARKERENRYRWTEITCISAQCHGVLVTSNDDGFRTTVRKGEKLSDGTMIQSISADGIRISIDGDDIAVRPAPNDVDAPAAATPEQSLADQLKAVGISSDGIPGPVSDASAPPADTSANDTGNAPAANDTQASVATADGAGNSDGAGQTVVEPALGPSGLF